MRCVAGLVRPTAGTVRVAGHDVQTASLDARRALAMIPDVPQLFPHLTVEEHVRLVARLYGVADVAQKLGPLFDELQLTDRVRELPGALSRGMRQKVAVACGLVHDPEALLFDEPLTGLDPVAIRRLKRIIRARADAGAAVVVSSHLLGLVEEIADRVAVLMEGEVVASGDLADLRSQRPELADAGLEEIFLRVTGAGDT
jgi:ABC-2 type transport system ATP-binding protein